MVHKTGADDFERVAALGPKVVSVKKPARPKDIDVRPFDELAVQQHIADRRANQRRAWSDVCVGLVLGAKEYVARKTARRLLSDKLLEITIDSRSDVRRRIGGQGLIEVVPRQLE